MDTISPQHEVTARKPHSCSWCNKEILPGEKYVTSTLKTEYIYEWRECSRCKPYVDEMFDDEIWGDYDPDYGVFPPDIEEAFKRESYRIVGISVHAQDAKADTPAPEMPYPVADGTKTETIDNTGKKIITFTKYIQWAKNSDITFVNGASKQFTNVPTNASEIKAPTNFVDRDGNPVIGFTSIRTGESVKPGQRIPDTKKGNTFYAVFNGGNLTDLIPEPEPTPQPTPEPEPQPNPEPTPTPNPEPENPPTPNNPDTPVVPDNPHPENPVNPQPENPTTPATPENPNTPQPQPNQPETPSEPSEKPQKPSEDSPKQSEQKKSTHAKKAAVLPNTGDNATSIAMLGGMILSGLTIIATARKMRR